MDALQAGIDLTPFHSEYAVEGMMLPNVFFADGVKKTFYTPPRGWTYAGSPARLSFVVPGQDDVRVAIERVEVKVPAAFDAAMLKVLKDDSRALLPAIASDITVAGEEKNALVILQSETFRVSYSYAFKGRRFAAAMLYVNRGDCLLRCRVEAPLSVFPTVQREFMASLCSFQN